MTTYHPTPAGCDALRDLMATLNRVLIDGYWHTGEQAVDTLLWLQRPLTLRHGDGYVVLDTGGAPMR